MAAVQGSALSKVGDVEEEAQVRRAIAASLAYGGSATGSSTGGSASADDVGLTACGTAVAAPLNFPLPLTMVEMSVHANAPLDAS